nr:enoyl-CoA hydratase/isomerase [Nocardiopsis halotolerans]
MSHETLRVRQQGTTCFVRIHRPEADNALNAAMVRELGGVLTRASDSPTTTVVVIEGLPEVFCFGADFGVISDAAREGRDTAYDPEPMFELFRQIAYGDFVTVAHVRGRANAGGMGIVAASDVVIADDTASFSLSELLFGLVPAVVLPFLARRVGSQRARYLAGTTQVIDAGRACQWGLVDATGTDSQALLRGHLRRLNRLSKKAVVRYKSYLGRLSPVPEHDKDVALAANREAFDDPENVRAIRRYTEQGLFPWEDGPTNDDTPTPNGKAGTPMPPPEASEAERRRSPMPSGSPAVTPESLGDPGFREDYGLRYNYVAGGMYKGIASVELVTALGNAGMLGFLGTGGLPLDVVDDSITRIEQGLRPGRTFGVNLLSAPQEPDLEMRMVELLLRHGVRHVEASAYVQPSAALVRYRLAGLSQDANGGVRQENRVIAKVSRTEVAEGFLRPAPPDLVRELLERRMITPEQAELGARVPLAHDLCVEADSAGHTDAGNAYVLMPAMRAVRDRVRGEAGYSHTVRIGAAGGIGTPESALAALMLGADFIVTGSINQCTAEAGTSEAVKDILQGLGVHDTGYAPAGDMFEVGARVQAVRKGLFFPARANKLYELYTRHGSIDDLDARTRTMLEEKYFKRSIDAVWRETREHLARRYPERLADVEGNPKQRMARIFRWYFVHSTRLAMSGSAEQRVDYQIHCGPAMGAFNAWVKGTPLEPWHQRRVAVVAEHLLRGTAELLGERLGRYGRSTSADEDRRPRA